MQLAPVQLAAMMQETARNPVKWWDLIDVEFSGFWPVKLFVKGGWTEDGSGNDVIHANTNGLNIVIGGSGNDTITTSGQYDFVLGDSFNAGVNVGIDFSGLSRRKSFSENLASIETSFQIPGLAGEGNDTISAGDGVLIAHAGGGNDRVRGGTVFSLVDGGDGDDQLLGRSGANGGAFGFDVLIGGDGNDKIRGNDYSNVLIGDGVYFGAKLPSLEDLKRGVFDFRLGLNWYGDGDDTIRGGNGFDFIVGGAGNDVLNGRHGTNVMFGDTFEASVSVFGFGKLFTNAFQSVLLNKAARIAKIAQNLFRPSGAGDDQIFGGSGTDITFGGRGTDTISGGSGDFNLLIGGDGVDRVFSNRDLDFLFD